MSNILFRGFHYISIKIIDQLFWLILTNSLIIISLFIQFMAEFHQFISKQLKNVILHFVDT
jgi:hypothetical protein